MIRGRFKVKTQLMIVFSGLLALLVLAFLFLNINFLKSYYLRDKEGQFQEMYEALNKATTNGQLEDEDTYMELVHLAEKYNLSFLVTDASSGIFYTNVHDKDSLSNQMLRHYIEQDFLEDQAESNEQTQDSEETQDDSHSQSDNGDEKSSKDQPEIFEKKDGSTKKILSNEDNYCVIQTKDPVNNTDYLEMYGKCDDTSGFIVRSPLESIEESVAISNRFFLAIGCFLMVVILFLAWLFARRLTAPIKELADLSDRMADLDFEAKYTSGGKDEIGELGDNFNRMSEKLESTISELKKANNSLKKDIQQKEQMEEMRNEFLGNVSHELKTPIALIQGYAEGLKEGISDDPEDRAYYCSVIMDEADKMNQMVKNLLTLNQLEFGEDDLVFEKFDVTEIIRSVLSNMQIMAQQDDAKVIFRQETPVYVWADAFKVEQVIRNYVSNAFHHLDGEKVIEVKIKIEDSKARISVFNTGTPIPEDDLAHIWDKFYKVDKAHTREYGGNGIGLSIVKAIMRSLHQEYGVKNYDNGVEFWFELGVE